MTEVDKSVFEGAGFLLFHVQKNGKQCNLILGERQKKPEDELKDATVELEYQGGKPEKQKDGTAETPPQTAEGELNEEVGCYRDPISKQLVSVLDEDWQGRAHVLWTFQPISKKWIVAFLLQVNDAEYERLKTQDAILAAWPALEKRDFSSVTGRSELSRKALKGLFLAPVSDVTDLIAGFAQVPATSNRMKDAKEYGKTAKKMSVCSIADETKVIERPMRGFNLVIFEQHAAEIKKITDDACSKM